MHIRVLIFSMFLCLVLAGCDKRDAGINETQLHLPEDLSATLWAESPMFFNPTNMDIDSKGRIWITEAVNYRSFNNDSTRTLHHQKGDRVVILSDTDDDGKADDSKVFVQDKDLVSPLGIAVIGNKVYVSCSPNLIVYTDENGDDQPDKKEIFLTGFGGLDHDHSLHAIVGGMDGSLYFPTGNAGPHIVKDKSGWTLRSGSIYTGGSPYNTKNAGNLKSDDGKVWVGGLALRINPDGARLKVIGHNFRNAYELAVDSRGDVWQNDNDDQVVTCRTTWLMEGGNAGYFSTDGTRYWQADQRPGQEVFTAHWHQEDPGVIPAGDKTGAGAPTGIVVNEGDGLGEKYRGMLLSADAGRNVIFGYHPKRHQSGYEVGRYTTFITSLSSDNETYVWNDSAENLRKDKWFRPSDIAIGTDGAIYIADWFDPVVGGHQMDDTVGYGRIYRIVPKNKVLIRPAIDMSTTDGQLAALLSPAVNVRYAANEKLKARGADIIPKVKPLLTAENPFHRARAIWLLASLGEQGRDEVEKLLNDKDEEVRMVAFRALRHYSSDVVPLAQRLIEDPSPFVAREVIISLSEYPYEIKKPLLLALLRNFDPKDRWYVEALGTAVTGYEEDFMNDISKTLSQDSHDPTTWSDAMEAIAWRLHPAPYADQFKVRAESNKLSKEQRQRAITALAFINDKRAVSAMIDLTKNPDQTVAEQATYWVAFRQSNDWYSLVNWKSLNIDPARERKIAEMKVKRDYILDERMPFDEKRRSARDMSKDVIGSSMLLSMVAEGKLPNELFDVVREPMLKHKDPTIRTQAVQYFTKDDKRVYDIASIVRLKSDAAEGKNIFLAKCGTCHRVGDMGHDIGPELTQIKKKFDRQGLAEAIVNPSAGIVFGYEAWTIQTKDGQSYFGFLVADGQDVVTIKDLSGVKQTIPVKVITARKKSENSLMPEASALGINDQQLADIVGFLSNAK